MLKCSWSDCSRSCGGGIRRSYRLCDSPAPSAGGLFCLGDRVRYESCNTVDCADKGGEDFRLEQCKVFDGNNFGINDVPADVQWVPKYTGRKCSQACNAFYAPCDRHTCMLFISRVNWGQAERRPAERLRRLE